MSGNISGCHTGAGREGATGALWEESQGAHSEAQDSPATRNSLVQTVIGAEIDKFPERNRKLKALKFQRNGNAKK